MKACLRCGNPIKSWRTYCGTRCRDLALGDEALRGFWDKVKKTDGCWEWQAARMALGYGRIGVYRQQWLAHRLAWTLTNGPIPKGLFVCHRCDNPPCVRPDHLFLGTYRDNGQDMARKGRAGTAGLRGSQIGNAVLNEEKAREIKRLRSEGVPQREVAAMFGVSRRTIQFIDNGQRWAHVA